MRLLHDGALELIVDPALASAVAPWLPSAPRSAAAPCSDPRATMHVMRDLPARPTGLTAPTLTAGEVTVWVDAEREIAYLECTAAGCAGLADLVRCTAVLGATPAANGLAAAMSMMLVVTSALLVGRLQRAMIHAAAVVDPTSETAWLLIGDSGAGKSSTTATFVRGGWKYLSDDGITVSRDEERRLLADGWAQPFHLDTGWQSGVPTGQRGTMPLETFGPHAWQPTARIGGVLFPRVDAGAPSVAHPVAPTDALSRIIRQSPWLMADTTVAPATLSLLSALAAGKCTELRLGRDSFANPSRLAACIEKALI